MTAKTKARRPRQPRLPIEVRRTQVLDAALRLITQSGYGAATMEAIAREAEIAKPVVYNAYPGRGPLLEALLEREERRGLEALAAATPPPSDLSEGRAGIMGWLDTLARTIAENPASWRLILERADETPVEVRERVDRGRALALEQIRSLIATLVDARPSLAELDVELTAHSLLAAAENAARLMIADPQSYPPERLVGHAAQLLGALHLR